MPPAGGQKSKAFSSGIATQADDAKYKTKYKELKAKITEVEEDNTKLQLRILKSKKSITRLRVERAILYDRLQTSAQPTNPFALHAAPHLAALASSSAASTSTHTAQPPSVLQPPPYPLADPEGPALYLKELDAKKLAALKEADEWGAKPVVGIQGEQERKAANAVSPLRVENGNGNGNGAAPASDGMQVDSTA